MIIGKGMVASALKEISGWDDDVIFSSGVSNSGELDQHNYQREVELVKSYLTKVKHPASFVYFSTISIFDPSKAENAYIRHKLFIEDLIQNSSVNYLILRLPNLVGFSKNPNTLTNYFANSIRQNSTIILNAHAIRHLIDVADLSSILHSIKNKFGQDQIIVNVNTNSPLTARKIIAWIEVALKKNAIIQKNLETEDLKICNENRFESSLNYQWNINEDYHRKLFMKYYST